MIPSLLPPPSLSSTTLSLPLPLLPIILPFPQPSSFHLCSIPPLLSAFSYSSMQASVGVSKHVSSESMLGTHATLPSTVIKITLRDFEGLDDSTIQVLHAMMEFSYYSAVGNMDGAYKSIKLIKKLASVYTQLAHTCITDVTSYITS